MQAMTIMSSMVTRRIGIDMQIFPGRQIAVTRVGDQEISTVELPRLPGDDIKFETCIFPDHGLSHVVARYDTEEEARFKHDFLVEHQRRHLVANAADQVMEEAWDQALKNNPVLARVMQKLS